MEIISTIFTPPLRTNRWKCGSGLIPRYTES